MTPRLPRISGKDVKRAPLKAGFREVHTRAAITIWNRSGREVSYSSDPWTKTLKQKTLKSILGQAGLTADELVRLL